MTDSHCLSRKNSASTEVWAAEMRRRKRDGQAKRAERIRGLLTLRIVWAVASVFLCKALFDSFDLNGGFSLE